jgi:hypothetical protein
MRLRTSCCELPQNEQDNCSGAAIRVIWQAPSCAYQQYDRTRTERVKTKRFGSYADIVVPITRRTAPVDCAMTTRLRRHGPQDSVKCIPDFERHTPEIGQVA